MAGFENQVMVAKNVNFDHLSNPPHNGIVTSDGQLLIGSTSNPNIAMVANTLTAGTGISITNAPGSITIANTASTTDLHVAKWIVNNVANSGGNQTTIQGALNSASSGDTIFVMPGSTGIYTENLTITKNVNIVAFMGDSLIPNVTLIGKITCTSAVTFSITNMRLQTNSDFVLAVTGSAATIAHLNNCYLNCTNNTGISFTTSSSSAQINLNSCMGDIGTTGITLFTQSSAGTLSLNYCRISNSGGTSTVSTVSAGAISVFYSNISFPFTSSSTGGITFISCRIDSATQNVTTLTVGGSGSNNIISCAISSGTASCVSIGATATMADCTLNSTNTNAVTGLGTLIYSGLFMINTGTAINTSTLTARNIITGGISFNAGTDILNTYSTGTYTPTITGASTAGVQSYSVQTGRWTKIGRLVYVTTHVITTANSGTGNAQISLPFAISASSLFSSGGLYITGGTAFVVSYQGAASASVSTFNLNSSGSPVAIAAAQDCQFSTFYEF